jgi:hypothetical protein
MENVDRHLLIRQLIHNDGHINIVTEPDPASPVVVAFLEGITER